ncbi:MAG: hypothetical protein E7578_01250 [Ruminococcaceae bacterium]|nr:hypothetical protein [Oscillospiraceae bacterium]
MNKQRVDEIITEYLPKIYGFSVKKAFTYDEAEEISAMIVEQVYTSLLKMDEVYNIDGYIRRISKHAYSKYVSSVKRHEGVSIDGMMIPFEQDFTLTEEVEDEILRLRREIAFLTKTRREIVYSFYFANKKISRIADDMGIPEGTVKWHLNRARNEMKEGFTMERKIGKLGINPVKARGFGHGGHTGSNDGPEYYLGDSLNLNIVYSVYFEPRTKEEIAEELGVTLVFIEDRIATLEENGFLVRQAGDKYTTYVHFDPETFSLEMLETKRKSQLEVAKMLAEKYVPAIRESISGINDVYIPSGNRELFEAAMIFYGINHCCSCKTNKDLSKYYVRTTAGGEFICYVRFEQTQNDTDYIATLDLPGYNGCGDMIRDSVKYPSVSSWSVDTRYDTREGAWKNNLYSDYEYLYEYLTSTIDDIPANSEKFERLRSRGFITDDGRVNLMIAKGDRNTFFDMIPEPNEDIKKIIADNSLDIATMTVKDYPTQMQDLVYEIICNNFAGGFTVALMVMDILYSNGTFRPLTEDERVTSNLIMFSDVLPK